MCIEPPNIKIEMVNDSSISRDFDGLEFNFIPSHELVNIDIVVAERWLENDSHLTSESNEEPNHIMVNQNDTEFDMLPCGPLKNLVMQIKFCETTG